MKNHGSFPWIGALFILLACIQFEYHGDSWAFNSGGLPLGVGICAILSYIMLFQISRHFEEFCIANGWLPKAIDHRNDLLLPIAFLAVLPKIYYQSNELITYPGKEVPRWTFSWSHDGYDLKFIAAIGILVLLLRVRAIVRGLARQ